MRTAARYSVAVIATALALFVTAELAGLLAPMRLFFLWCAVLITAVLAGLGPAIVAIVLSLAGAAFLVFDPIGTFALHDSTDVLRLTMFAAFAGGISVVAALRRSAAGRARLSEQRYRTLIEATPLPQAVWTATADGRIAWSDAWVVITGQPRHELEATGGMHVVHPDDAGRTSQRWAAAVAQKTPYEDQIRVRVASGRFRWFAIRAVPLQIDRDRHEWVGIIADIHERKRHEEARSFINRASEVLSSSLGYEQTMRNLARLCVPALADSCAIDIGADETYERLVVEHVDPSRIELIREFDRRTRGVPGTHPVVQVLKSGQPALVPEVTEEMVNALGAADAEIAALAKTLNIRSSVIAPMRARGRSLGALSLVYNDSGRHYSEEDLPLIEELARRAATALDNARLYEAAESANRAKDEFLATLSHELRTPLTTISGWAHMLMTGMTDEQSTRVAVETIVRSAKAQGELIDDLLDLSRVVAGTLQLHVATVDLGELVREVTVAAGPAADAKGLTLELAPPQRVLQVRGDDRRLRQIVWNLVTNAVKFTDSGGAVRITVAPRGNAVRVEVSDTGRGIDAGFLPHVWDRFRQADSSASRQHGGLGLGLSVVRHLVELHGGTVQAASEGIGRGATFAVDLPLARPLADERAPTRVRAHAELLRGRTILVVDDDDDARLVIATMLRQHGADVAAAASVDQAASLFAARAFDAVVSDIAMPGQDGFALARHIRLGSAIPLIAVSAIATGPEDRKRALDAGFVEFVRKPVDPGQLALTVAGLLH
jgi:PAS domain S-box-containing protein